MLYRWVNSFNMIETDGPFPSIEVAKEDAVCTYDVLQNGMALDICIVEDDGIIDDYYENSGDRYLRNVKRCEKIICEGHIEGGKWGDGPHPKFARAMQGDLSDEPVGEDAVK